MKYEISIEYLAGAGDGGADVWVAEKTSHPYACGQGRTPSEALSNLLDRKSTRLNSSH